VRGKLVPQDPNDEPASELLEKIAQEKERLIKEGKIKKQKPLPKIREEEKPFELPKGWEWASLRHLGVFSGGKTSSKLKSIYWDGNIP
jgi:type I restriction enzyme, S subunit